MPSCRCFFVLRMINRIVNFRQSSMVSKIRLHENAFLIAFTQVIHMFQVMSEYMNNSCEKFSSSRLVPIPTLKNKKQKVDSGRLCISLFILFTYCTFTYVQQMHECINLLIKSSNLKQIDVEQTVSHLKNAMKRAQKLTKKRINCNCDPGS